MTKLFLDVDGVLNVLPYGGKHQGKWDDYTTTPVTTFGQTFEMTISRKCCDALASLPIEIVWLTTWGEQANEKLADITGFDHLPVLAEMPFRQKYQWKMNAVEDWYVGDDGDRRFVWIDDEAIPLKADTRFPDALLIRTHESTGITPDHIEKIRAYCEG